MNGLSPSWRRLLAGWLLLLFSFSITPRQLLHDALANHKDRSAALAKGNHLQITQSGFMCKVDNLVAESPFTQPASVQYFIPLPVPAVHPSQELLGIPLQTIHLWSLRGPPAANA
ncbi:MAG: hypothetical protein KGO82_07410 [Bacteroidota bacterium]|nr:hypothetical protein [Bacteroidota bacterium]